MAGYNDYIGTVEYHSGKMFTTIDRDNDTNPGACSSSYGAGWYGSCHNINPFGNVGTEGTPGVCY